MPSCSHDGLLCIAMILPTEPIGSIPRPPELIAGVQAYDTGAINSDELERLYDAALRDTILRFEATGSPVISDGEQRKFDNFASYAVHGAANVAANVAGDGVDVECANGVRRLPRLTAGPFRYMRKADAFLSEARRYTRRPLKQAIIAPSAVSLLYADADLPDYRREDFLASVVSECASEIQGCLDKGAHTVQLDFTEARLACKLDGTGALLSSFIALNNLALRRFAPWERQRIGVHLCPGRNRDATPGNALEYAELSPGLFELDAGAFFVALARENNRPRVLRLIQACLKPQQRVYVGVVDVLDPRVESAEEVCERILEAAEYIPLAQLGTTDDCGYSPFDDNHVVSRDNAFAKIRSRVEGTRLAADTLKKGSRARAASQHYMESAVAA